MTFQKDNASDMEKHERFQEFGVSERSNRKGSFGVDGGVLCPDHGGHYKKEVDFMVCI